MLYALGQLLRVWALHGNGPAGWVGGRTCGLEGTGQVPKMTHGLYREHRQPARDCLWWLVLDRIPDTNEDTSVPRERGKISGHHPEE